MSLTTTVTYDASPEAVYAMVTDPAYWERALAAGGALNHHADIAPVEGSDARVVTTRRTLSTTSAPDVVRRIVGPSVLVTQTTSWGAADPSGARTAQVRVEVEGVPLAVGGVSRLTPAESGTSQSYDVDISARVPLIGGRIADAVRPLLLSAIKAERLAGRAWLAEHETPST